MLWGVHCSYQFSPHVGLKQTIDQLTSLNTPCSQPHVQVVVDSPAGPRWKLSVSIQARLENEAALEEGSCLTQRWQSEGSWGRIVGKWGEEEMQLGVGQRRCYSVEEEQSMGDEGKDGPFARWTFPYSHFTPLQSWTPFMDCDLWSWSLLQRDCLKAQ